MLQYPISAHTLPAHPWLQNYVTPRALYTLNALLKKANPATLSAPQSPGPCEPAPDQSPRQPRVSVLARQHTQQHAPDRVVVNDAVPVMFLNCAGSRLLRIVQDDLGSIQFRRVDN